MTKYKKNYLNEVILRIDFDRIELANLSKFKKFLESDFPKHTKKLGMEGNLRLDATTGNVESTQSEFSAWAFTDKETNKTLEVSEKYLFIQYTKYEDSEVLLKDAKNIMDKFVNDFGIKTINRLGLRYINELGKGDNDKKPEDWKKYIDQNLYGGVAFTLESNLEPSRTLAEIHFKDDTSVLVLRHGIWNKEYPSKILSAEYVLDFDCYTYLPFNPAESSITEITKEFNGKIEKLFEQSITEELRKELNK